MLGWVAEKKPQKTMLDVEPLLSQGAFDREKWALHLVLTSGPGTDAGLQITMVEMHGFSSLVEIGAGFLQSLYSNPDEPHKSLYHRFFFIFLRN